MGKYVVQEGKMVKVDEMVLLKLSRKWISTQIV